MIHSFPKIPPCRNLKQVCIKSAEFPNAGDVTEPAGCNLAGRFLKAHLRDKMGRWCLRVKGGYREDIDQEHENIFHLMIITISIFHPSI